MGTRYRNGGVFKNDHHMSHGNIHKPYLHHSYMWWAAKTLFNILGFTGAFRSFKGFYQRRYYFREQLYSQTSLKA